MLDPASGGAEKHIGKESMAMRAHCDQVATFLLNPFDDLGRRFAVRQFSLGRNPLGLKLCPNLLQIGRVIGEDELRTLIFKRGRKVFKLQSMPS